MIKSFRMFLALALVMLGALSVKGQESLSLVENTVSTVVDDMRTNEWHDIQLDLTNGAFLTSDELNNGIQFSFGIVADSLMRVDAGDSSADVILNGKFHSYEHGWTHFSCTVPVKGPVRIGIGACAWGGDVTVKNSEGESVTIFNSANIEKCYHSNKIDNIVYAYYSGEATTLTISGGSYVPYVSIEAVTEIIEEATVTYSLGNVQAEGILPAQETVIAGKDKVTIPMNRTLYIEGKTLVGWTDGNVMYVPGQEIIPVSDMILTPLFTDNPVSLSDRTEEISIVWDFRRMNGTPALVWQGVVGFLVSQAVVNGQTIDVRMEVDVTNGKLANGNWSDWCQVNNGTKFSIPVCKGATVSLESYTSTTTTTIAGDIINQESQTPSYTYNGDADVIDVVIGDGFYFRYIKVVLPVVDDDLIGKEFEDEEASVVLASWNFRDETLFAKDLRVSVASLTEEFAAVPDGTMLYKSTQEEFAGLVFQPAENDGVKSWWIRPRNTGTDYGLVAINQTLWFAVQDVHPGYKVTVESKVAMPLADSTMVSKIVQNESTACGYGVSYTYTIARNGMLAFSNYGCYMYNIIVEVPVLQQNLVDSLNTLIDEVKAYQETLDLTIPTQQMVHDTLTKEIETARLIAETADTIPEIRYAYTNLYSAYATVKIHLAKFEADAARAYPGTGGLIGRIYEIAEYMPIMGSGYTLSDLDAAVQELRELVESLKVNVTSIYLDYDFLSMNRNDVMEISATVYPENATDRTVTWYSSDESVATVNNGIVTAVGLGEAYVVACAGVHADTCVVNVWEDTESKNILIENLKLKIEEVEAWRSSLNETDTIRMMVIENAEYLIQTAETLIAGLPTIEELEAKIQELVSFMDSYPEMVDTYDAAVEAIRIAEELMAAHPEINSTSLVSYMSRLERELKAYGLNRVSRVQSYTRSLNSRIESFRNSLNYFAIPNVEARLYEPFTLPVSMTNDEEISAFQCDIYLHGDLEMNLNAEGDYDIKLNADRATSSHTVASELQADGAIRVIVYSNGSKLFKGNSGELFTIGLTALSAESPVDTVTGISIGVSVRNIRLSTSDEREILIDGVDAHVTVKTYTPADANGDGTVSIVDVVAVVNNILGRNAGNFIFEAADMDHNGQITIVDVVAVVNTLMGKDVQAYGARSLLRSDIHVADAEVSADGTSTLYVKLDNAQAYTAMQMDVDLPEGLSLEGVEMVGCPSHAVVCNEEGRIAAYSLNSSRFSGSESLMAITVKADESFAGNALVGFTNVRVVSTNVQETLLSDVLANIAGGGATGIDGVLADAKVQILYYSATGAVSDKPHKGLNVIKRIYEDGRVEVSKEVCE